MEYRKFEKFLIVAMCVLIIVGFLFLPFVLMHDDKIIKSVVIVEGDYVSKEYSVSNLGMVPGSEEEREIKIDFQTGGKYEIIVQFEEIADGGLKDYVSVSAEYSGEKLIDDVTLADAFELAKTSYVGKFYEKGECTVLKFRYLMPEHVGDGMTNEQQQSIMGSYADFNMILTLKRV